MSTRVPSAVQLTAWAWLAAVLGCAALAPLVAANRFLLVGGLAGLLVAAVAALCRVGNVPVALMVPLQLVVLGEWLTITYAGAETRAGVLPTGASTAYLIDLVRSALETARTSVPPAPVDTAVLACLATIVALTVVVVDVVVVTLRRPALVGLVLLGLYMAPVSLLAGNVPVTAFLPGAIGYVLLLAAEQRARLSSWGRQITSTGSLLAGRERATSPVTSLVSAGRRVGFGAVALAVVLPVLVPTLPRTLLGDGPLTVDGGASGGGDGSVEVDNPMLDLKRNLDGQSDSALLTLQTDDPDPAYLRLAALDTFDGSSWAPGERPSDTSLDLDQTPVAPGLGSDVDRSRFVYDVEFTSQFQSTWLPTTYPVTEVEAEGDWGIDAVQLDVSARDEDLETPGMRYRFTSFRVTPAREQLERADALSTTLDPFLALPDDLPDVIGAVARDVTADAELPIDRALALQSWFRENGGFRYSLDRAPGDSMETIVDFLTTDKVGYCEQFAASMALMARTLGIPARVGVGFLRPQPMGEDLYLYRGTDMHAWPELYFDGVGWLRFEPTPSRRTGDQAPSYSSEAGPEADDPTASTGPTTGSTQDPELRTPLGPEATAAASGGGGDDGGSPPAMVWAGLGLLALLALAGTPRLLRAEVRRRRWAAGGDAAEPAWAELRDGTVDLGLPFDDRATLRTAGQGLRGHVDSDPAAVDALNRLVIRVEKARFAPGGTSAGLPGEMSATRADVDRVLGALAAGRHRRRLLRATWLPMSLFRRAGGDAGGWFPGRGVLTREGAVVQVEGTATR